MWDRTECIVSYHRPLVIIQTSEKTISSLLSTFQSCYTRVVTTGEPPRSSHNVPMWGFDPDFKQEKRTLYPLHYPTTPHLFKDSHRLLGVVEIQWLDPLPPYTKMVLDVTQPGAWRLGDKTRTGRN